MTQVIAPYQSVRAQGSVDDITYFVRHGRQFIRSRLGPGNQSTTARIRAQDLLTAISQAWSTLSTSERAMWTANARLGADPRQEFIRYQWAAADYNSALLSQPGPAYDTLYPTNLQASEDGGDILLNYDTNRDSSGEDALLDVWVSSEPLPGRLPRTSYLKHFLYGPLIPTEAVLPALAAYPAIIMARAFWTTGGYPQPWARLTWTP